MNTPKVGIRDLTLDSLGRVTRPLGGSPRQMRAQQLTRDHRSVIAAGPIKNHLASQDLPSPTLPGSPKSRV